MQTDHTSSYYDVLIVGGGITGGGIFRDLCLQGHKTLLIDKKDFASQTSHRSSKMLHGGIRYLEHFDFALVKEALHEKNLWKTLTPHLTQEHHFTLPVYNDSKWPLPALKAGLWLYDLLSGLQNPPHKILFKQETLKELPGLKSKGLQGSGLYSDVFVDDAKLALENILDGLANSTHSKALNHVSLKGLKKDNNGLWQAALFDELVSKEKTVKAKKIIFSLGPFTDLLLGRLFPHYKPRLLPSKGIHLWIKHQDLPLKGPMVIQSSDGRIIFVNPWPEGVMVGTTETEVKEDFFDINAKEEEENYLLENLKHYFPDLPLSRESILSSYAGIRPLVAQEGASAGKVSRHHQVFYPAQDAVAIVGGKLTTFRAMAQDVARGVSLSLGVTYKSKLTEQSIPRRTQISSFSRPQELAPDILTQMALHEGPRTWEDFFHRRLGVYSESQWPYAMKISEVKKFWEGLDIGNHSPLGEL